MTKISRQEKEDFKDIITEDMRAINRKCHDQIDLLWEKAKKHLITKLGHDKLIEKKKELRNQIADLQEEIHQIEETLNGEPLTVKQAKEFGGEIDYKGRASDATFYGKPITSQFEYKIAKLIKKNINLEAPAKFLHDLGRSALREITMCGTFETAQKIYQKFYALDFRKYGVDIPPRLAEIKKNIPLLEQKDKLKKISYKKKVINDTRTS